MQRIFCLLWGARLAALPGLGLEPLAHGRVSVASLFVSFARTCSERGGPNEVGLIAAGKAVRGDPLRPEYQTLGLCLRPIGWYRFDP